MTKLKKMAPEFEQSPYQRVMQDKIWLAIPLILFFINIIFRWYSYTKFKEYIIEKKLAYDKKVFYLSYAFPILLILFSFIYLTFILAARNTLLKLFISLNVLFLLCISTIFWIEFGILSILIIVLYFLLFMCYIFALIKQLLLAQLTIKISGEILSILKNKVFTNLIIFYLVTGLSLSSYIASLYSALKIFIVNDKTKFLPETESDYFFYFTIICSIGVLYTLELGCSILYIFGVSIINQYTLQKAEQRKVRPTDGRNSKFDSTIEKYKLQNTSEPNKEGLSQKDIPKDSVEEPMVSKEENLNSKDKEEKNKDEIMKEDGNKKENKQDDGNKVNEKKEVDLIQEDVLIDGSLKSNNTQNNRTEGKCLLNTKAESDNGKSEDLDKNKIVQSSRSIAFKTSLGSACLGSLLITIIKVIKIFLKDRSRRNNEDGILMLLTICILNCFQGIVEFLTSTAYVYCALYGRSLFASGKIGIKSYKNAGADRLFNFILVEDLLNFGALSFSLFFSIITMILFNILFYYEDPTNTKIINEGRFFLLINFNSNNKFLDENCLDVLIIGGSAFILIISGLSFINNLIAGSSNFLIALFVEDPQRLYSTFDPQEQTKLCINELLI